MVHLNYIEIGRRIRAKRKELGLTQKELGTRVELSEGSVSKYESGKVEDATTSKLNDFATALDVDIGWLLGIEIPINNDALPITLAAHFDGEQFTEDELKEIIEYARYVKSKRKQQ